MDVVATHVRERIVRFVGEGQELLALLPGILDQVERLEQRCEALQQTLEALRSDHERLLAERSEVAESLSGMLNQLTRPVTELVERLRTDRGHQDAHHSPG